MFFGCTKYHYGARGLRNGNLKFSSDPRKTVYTYNGWKRPVSWTGKKKRGKMEPWIR